MKRISKKTIAKFTSMLILSGMLIAVPVGMSRESTVTANAAAAQSSCGSSGSSKSFGCSSGFDIKSILGITDNTSNEQSNTCTNTASSNNSCSSDKSTCTKNSCNTATTAQNSSNKTTASKNNSCSGNTCTTSASSSKNSTCTGNSCSGSSCKNNTCTSNSCSGSTCTGSNCTGSTCTGNTCSGNSCTSGNCTGNTSSGNAQSLSDLLNSLKSQLQKQTGTQGNTTTTSSNKGNTTTTSSNKGSTTTTSSNKNNSTTTTTTTTSASSSVSAYEKQVVTLVNKERAKVGLSALTLNTSLSKMARAKSQDMHDNNYFSHTSPTYGSPFDMMKTFGISYSTAGENIAMGYTSPEAVVEGWMNSAGHRANILNANFTQIGVGYVADGNYWTQEFIG